jgi:hypothetical protein
MSPPSAKPAVDSPALHPEADPIVGGGAPRAFVPLPLRSAEEENAGKAAAAVAGWDKMVSEWGTPTVWQIQQKAVDVQQSIQELTDTLQEHGIGGPPPKSLEPEGKFQADMQAIGQGKLLMDMRSAQGRHFYKELNLDAQLKAEFAKCGKVIEKQHSFKQKWCKARYAVIVQSRAKMESSFDLQSIDAEYCPFSRIVQREGGDIPAFVTAQTYVRNAMKEWQAKRLWHGHPWIKHDAMRGGAVVLHYREKLSSGSSTTWDVRTAEHTTHQQAPVMPVANAPGSSSDDPTKAEGEQPEEPVAKKGKKNPKASAAAIAATAAAAEEDSAKKSLQTALRKAALLKLDVSKATQAGLDIMTLMANDPDWAWCNNNDLLGPIRHCLRKMEEWKKSTKFWQAWTVEENLAACCKKHFKPEQVIAAITQAHRDDDEESFRKLTDRLQSATTKLKRMQASKNQDD